MLNGDPVDGLRGLLVFSLVRSLLVQHCVRVRATWCLCISILALEACNNLQQFNDCIVEVASSGCIMPCCVVAPSFAFCVFPFVKGP